VTNSTNAYRASQSQFIEVRTLRYHLRMWGDEATPERTLVMLHGWMDVSASFQFVVDALGAGWRVIAPDWRGYGLSAWSGDSYWFADYLADLESVLDQVSGSAAVNLVGHSMGGNIALLYAGIRPQRVRSVVNLEGFGLRDSQPSQAPARYAQWLDELKQASAMRDYGSQGEVAARLRRTNPRLTPERAEFLAPHWAHLDGEGRWRVAGDPAHRIINPVLYRLEEVLACWRRVTCPVLWVRAAETEVMKFVDQDPASALAEVERRMRAVPDVRSEVVENAGHMMNHDQPDIVASMIASFVSQVNLASGAEKGVSRTAR
jgi:pimeloyl-ACP methyl ester carboxylesterase